MKSIWVGIDPRPEVTRVLAMAGPTATLLKARMPAVARHPRAVPSLLEALALWTGAPVRAALAVDETDHSSATRLSLDWDFGGPPLYALEHTARLRRPVRQTGLGGLGDFRDLRQLVLFEVAR